MPIPVIPTTPVVGAGYLSAAASALISTMTFDANGPQALPSTATVLYVGNVGATIYIRPFGGTASAAAGIPIATGSPTVALNLANPQLATIFCATSSAVAFWW